MEVLYFLKCNMKPKWSMSRNVNITALSGQKQ